MSGWGLDIFQLLPRLHDEGLGVCKRIRWLWIFFLVFVGNARDMDAPGLMRTR